MTHQLLDLLTAGAVWEGEIDKPVERTSDLLEYVMEDTVVPVIILTGLNTFLLIPSNLLGRVNFEFDFYRFIQTNCDLPTGG